MKISVRAYEEKDLPEMIRIWNEVVADGVAFPQEELLNAETGKEFLPDRPTAPWQRIRKPEKCTVFTSCIPTTWDAAVISATPAMR